MRGWSSDLRLHASTAWEHRFHPWEEAKIPYAGADQKSKGGSEGADSPPGGQEEERSQWSKKGEQEGGIAAFKEEW